MFEVGGVVFNDSRSFLCSHVGSKLADTFGPNFDKLPKNEDGN